MSNTSTTSDNKIQQLLNQVQHTQDQQSAEFSHLADKINNLMNNPKIQDIISRPGVQQFMNNPEFQKLASNPEFQKLKNNPEFQSLMNNLGAQQLMDKPKVRQFMDKHHLQKQDRHNSHLHELDNAQPLPQVAQAAPSVAPTQARNTYRSCPTSNVNRDRDTHRHYPKHNHRDYRNLDGRGDDTSPPMNIKPLPSINIQTLIDKINYYNRIEDNYKFIDNGVIVVDREKQACDITKEIEHIIDNAKLTNNLTNTISPPSALQVNSGGADTEAAVSTGAIIQLTDHLNSIQEMHPDAEQFKSIEEIINYMNSEKVINQYKHSCTEVVSEVSYRQWLQHLNKLIDKYNLSRCTKLTSIFDIVYCYLGRKVDYANNPNKNQWTDDLVSALCSFIQNIDSFTFYKN